MTDTPPQTDPDTTEQEQQAPSGLTGSAAPQVSPEAEDDAAYLDDDVPEGGDPYSNSEGPVEQEVDL